MRLGPGKHLEGRVLMNGIVKPEEFDQFHELIIWQELGRLHARGYSDGLGIGTCIGLPPVLVFGSPELKAAILPDILNGKKFICLAVTEAFAGSDVAGIKCRASRTKGGWIVNGTKKWITNGTFADYFTVACRSDEGKIVVLVVTRGEGVTTKIIKTAYATAAGTSYITFDNVFVPDLYHVGPGRDGLQVVLSNFNHERWVIISASVAWQRIVTEECLKYVTQRKVFGNTLGSQAVVRSKLAAMISRVEAAQQWLENITYQMNNMTYAEQANELAGPIAFCKLFATSSAQDTARDAVQIFGGRGITKSGMGKFIEHYHRTLLIDAIGGGTEDVMGDLGVRQALRKMPKTARL
jgi:alkylation response protein AidB-like acyl-CoA dehydrogenase